MRERVRLSSPILHASMSDGLRRGPHNLSDEGTKDEVAFPSNWAWSDMLTPS